MSILREQTKASGHPVILCATTRDVEKVAPATLSVFRHQIACETPSESARQQILSSLLRESHLAPDVDLAQLARQTAAFVHQDLVDLVARAGVGALERVGDLISTDKGHIQEEDIVKAGIALTARDFDVALDAARSAHSDTIGAPKIPTVTWDDVGGLSHVKESVFDTIQLPLERPELFAEGMRKRSGLLLYGPPGTGKTLIAKAVATTFSLNFLSVKGPELLNMYIGESEANVRRVFQRARDARPCVVFFDELDSVAPKRGEKGDSGGVMDRIVSQLLAEIDGMDGGGDVFVIGATNRPDLLDGALLRPGRFDKMLYLGVSEDHESQLRILQALTRKFNLAPDLDLRVIAEQCPFNCTGADFYALCSDAMLKAMIRTIGVVDAKIASLNESGTHPPHPHPIKPQYYLEVMASKEEIGVQVGEEDFRGALRELVPSVSEGELERYREIRRKFEDGGKGGERGSERVGGSGGMEGGMGGLVGGSSTDPPANDNVTEGTGSGISGQSKGKSKGKGKGKGKGRGGTP
ncbi:peroxisomal assembly protein [Rhizophlyctis rosea]|nr:peroxisomal assembly protein [Rhizophlyctis rosea]